MEETATRGEESVFSSRSPRHVGMISVTVRGYRAAVTAREGNLDVQKEPPVNVPEVDDA